MPDGAPPRFSLNQITARSWSLAEAVAGCAAAGVTGIGLWRDKVAETGVAEAARLCADAGLAVTSLCRGGFFTAESPAGRQAALEDNQRAVDEAAALGTDVLVLVCGGMVGRDLAGSRAMVAEGLAALAPYAAEHGVRLALEPLHPMLCADRSVLATLGQALDLAEAHPPEVVGVMVDAYHVWWDPDLDAQLARAGDRILGFQVCDWVQPPPDVLLGRALPGDGVIDLRGLRARVDAAGYTGPIEVEIFAADLWSAPGEQVLRACLDRFRDHVG
jgi:sugar phosphate isomerase/epimerase